MIRGPWKLEYPVDNDLIIYHSRNNWQINLGEVKLINARYEEQSDLLYLSLMKKGFPVIEVLPGNNTFSENIQFIKQLHRASELSMHSSKLEYTLIAHEDGVYVHTHDGEFLLKQLYAFPEVPSEINVSVFGSDKIYTNYFSQDVHESYQSLAELMVNPTSSTTETFAGSRLDHTSLFSQQKQVEYPKWIEHMFRDSKSVQVDKYLFDKYDLYSLNDLGSEAGITWINFKDGSHEDLSIETNILHVYPIVCCNDREYLVVETDDSCTRFYDLKSWQQVICCKHRILNHFYLDESGELGINWKQSRCLVKSFSQCENEDIVVFADPGLTITIAPNSQVFCDITEC